MKAKKQKAKNTDRWNGYFLDDTECQACLYYKGKKRALSVAQKDARLGRAAVSGCSLTACSCEDIKNDSIAKGKIKRKRGSMKWDM